MDETQVSVASSNLDAMTYVLSRSHRFATGLERQLSTSGQSVQIVMLLWSQAIVRESSDDTPREVPGVFACAGAERSAETMPVFVPGQDLHRFLAWDRKKKLVVRKASVTQNWSLGPQRWKGLNTAPVSSDDGFVDTDRPSALPESEFAQRLLSLSDESFAAIASLRADFRSLSESNDSVESEEAQYILDEAVLTIFDDTP
ncbi:MAG: hypothetical protein AAFX05_11690, partial [Planctomycetota bacterium]